MRLYSSTLPVAKSRPILLCIPSLINRYTVLDLNRDSSFVHFLNHTGYDCLVVEWHEPKAAQHNETMAHYVMKLLYALQEIWERINRPLVTIGYCIGGVIATALAQLFPRIIGLALLATPWDYGAYPCANFSTQTTHQLEEALAESPLLSADILQSFLYLANPYRLYQRYSQFATMKNEQHRAQFVAVEHWANEGVPITREVARECLIDWPKNNALLNTTWTVEGEKITPASLRIPTFAALPSHDQIVPTKAAYPLADQLHNVHIVRPESGHVGMIVGRKRHELLTPLSTWLQHYFH